MSCEGELAETNECIYLHVFQSGRFGYGLPHHTIVDERPQRVGEILNETAVDRHRLMLRAHEEVELRWSHDPRIVSQGTCM